MFNDFCNSFQALQTFSSLINFVCVFNVSLHILFCRIFFIVAINLELRFYQLRPYIYSFCQFLQALHVFFFAKFSMPYICSRPYVYSFRQIFQALCSFPAHIYSGVQSRHEKPFVTSKKPILLSKIVLTFHCLNELFQ